MKRSLKIAGSVIVVLLAALLILPLTLKGKIGDIVKSEANKMLTARLDFEELDISLLRHFPNASIDLNGLQLVSGVAPFEGDTIVAADRISVVVNLLSLFSDEGFEVRRILLRKPYIHGQKSAEGAVNWDVMKPSEAEEVEAIEQVDEVDEADKEAAPSSFRLALRDVTISEATLKYEDDSTRMRAAIAPLNLHLRGDFSALRSGLELETVASNILFENEGVRLANGLELELRADLDADLENKRFTLSDNLFRINAIRMMLSGEVALPEQGVEVDLELKSEEVEFREILSLIPLFYLQDFDQLKASGELTLSATAKGLLAGDRMPAFDLRFGVKEGSFKYASLPQSVTGIHLAAEVKNPGGTLDATRLNLSDFRMTMAGHSLAARLSAATPFSDLQFDFGADGKINLGAIKEVYPLGDSISLEGLLTLDVDAAGRLSDIEAQRFEEMQASGSITLEQMQASIGTLPEVEIERITASISPKALTLGDSQIRIGESDLQANGQLTNYIAWALRDEMLKGRLYLKSNLMNLNELLGAMPASEQDEEPKEEEPAAESGPIMAPEIPQNLDLSLETSFKRILFQRMTITDFTGNLAVKGGRVEMSKLAMQALGGSLSASASYSTAEEATAPRLKMKAEIRDASFSRTFDELDMVRKMVPLFEKTGGNYSLSLDLSTRMLQDLSIDYPSLNATGELRSGNIELGNVPIYSALSTALGGGKLPASMARDLVVKFAIANGRLSTQPFDLKLGSTTLNLSGSTGLDQTIDYTARVSLPGKAGSVVQNLNVKIQGTFAKPKITVDVAEAAREAATNLANSAVQQLTGSATVSEEIARQAERLRQEAVAAGERLVQAAEQQRQQMIDKASGTIAKLAATKAGDLLVQEAERQAANLVAEAERQINKLQGGEAN